MNEEQAERLIAGIQRVAEQLESLNSYLREARAMVLKDGGLPSRVPLIGQG